MIVWKLATRPVTAMSPRIEAAVPLPKIVLRPSRSGSSESAMPADPGAIPALRNSTRKPVTTSVIRAVDRPAGDVALRVVRLLRREWQLLDRQEEPDRERERVEDARDTVREPALVADRPAVEVDVRDRADVEDAQDRQGRDADEHGEAERRLHSDDVEPDEQDVEHRPPDR